MPIRKYNPFVGTRIYIAMMIIYILSYYSWLYIWRDDQWMKTVGSDFLGFCGFAVATVCLYYVYKQARGTERIFWYLIFLSLLSFIIAQIIWSYYDLILEVKVTPSPGLSDVFYLLQPTLILLSILNIIYKRENIFISFRLFLDILITMTVVVTLSWYFLLQPIFIQESDTLLFKLVALAYPLSDIGLILGVLGLNATSRTFSRNTHYTLVMGLTLFSIADSAFIYLSTKESYHSGSLVDPLWILASLLIGLAGLYSKNQIGKAEIADIRHKDIPYVFSFTRSTIPYISMFILLIVMFIRIWKLDSLVMGLIIGIFLISIRQIVNLLDNKRLILLLAQSNLELEISKKALEDKHEFLKQTSATIKLEAQTDYLTGLYNRRYIVQSLHSLIEQANLNNLNFSLFMLDIDHFKQINDLFGHEAGDDVLQQITQIMLKNTRCEEKIGRFGGEEFIGFLPEVVEEEAVMIAERIRKQIVDHTFLIGSQNIKVTVSIGVSQWRPNNNDDVQSLLKRIDKALYQAKDRGRNCTVVL